MSRIRIVFAFAIGLASVVAVAFGVSSCGGGGGGGATKTWTGPIDGQAVYRHVEQIVACGPRPSGSAALDKSIDYIRGEIKKLGLELQVHSFTDETNAPGITFKNLWTVIPGTDPKGRTMVVSAHYDTKKTSGHANPDENFPFVGAMDGGGGSGLLIELARALKLRKNRPNIWLVWFDGEESIPFTWDDERALFGSRKFVEKMIAEDKLPRVMVLFDLIGSKNFKIDRDLHSTKRLSDLFGEAAKAMGQGKRMYEFSQRQLVDDHRPFGEKGVNVIDLIDFRWRTPADARQHGDKRTPAADEYVKWWHTPEDDMHNMDPVALDFFGNLFMNTLPKIEARYYK